MTGFDPAAPTPAWMARRIQLAGMRPISLAVDVTNYVMLELGQPIHGFDRDKLAGPIVVRRARAGERVTTLDGADRELSTEDLLITDDSGPIGLAGRDGRRDDRAVGDDDQHLHRGRALGPGRDLPHRAPPQAAVRGVQALRARHRPDHPARRRGPGRRAADDVRRRHGRAGRDVRRRGAVARPPSRSTRACPLGSPAWTSPRRRRSPTCAPSAASSRSRARPLSVTPPPWRGDVTDPFDLVEEVARIVGYANVPSVLPPAAHGRGLTRSQQLRRRVGRTLAGEGFVEVVSFPFIGTRDLDALGAAGRGPAPARAAAGQPAVVRRAGDDHHAAARPAEGGRPQRRPRQHRPGPVRGGHRHAAAGHGSGADLRRRPAADRGPARRARQGAAGPAAAPRAGRLAATANAPAGGARAVRPPGPTRSTAYAARPRPSASR